MAPHLAGLQPMSHTSLLGWFHFLCAALLGKCVIGKLKCSIGFLQCLLGDSLQGLRLCHHCQTLSPVWHPRPSHFFDSTQEELTISSVFYHLCLPNCYHVDDNAKFSWQFGIDVHTLGISCFYMLLLSRSKEFLKLFHFTNWSFTWVGSFPENNSPTPVESKGLFFYAIKLLNNYSFLCSPCFGDTLKTSGVVFLSMLHILYFFVHLLFFIMVDMHKSNQ